MNTELLLREVLEREASTQPAGSDLYARSVANGRRRVHRRRAAWASAAVVVLVAALVPALRWSRPSAAPGEQPLPPTLKALADRVRALPSEPVHTTGAWFSERVVHDSAHPDEALRSDQWWLPDGRVRVLVGGQSSESSKPSAPTWVSLSTLPTEPTALVARLRTTLGPGVAALDQPELQLLGNVDELLAYMPSSPSLRAAVLDGLATDPAFRVEGFVDDVTHSQALSVSVTVRDKDHPDEAETERLGISTATGRVVSDQVVYSGTISASYTVTQWVPDDHTWPAGITPQQIAASSAPGTPDPAGSASVGAGSAGPPSG